MSKIIKFDASSIIFLIIGALISALIGFVFAIFRERLMLKTKLRIETADELQKLINEHQNKNQLISYSDVALVNLYNARIPFGADSPLVQNSKKILKENFDSLFYNFKSYSKALFAVTTYIESREIILSKFKHYHRKILDNYTDLINKKTKLERAQSSIITLLICSKKIDENTLHNYKQAFSEFKEKAWDIICNLKDMQIGLQGEIKIIYIEYSGLNLAPRSPAGLLVFY